MGGFSISSDFNNIKDNYNCFLSCALNTLKSCLNQSLAKKKKKTRVRTEGGWTGNCCKGDAVKVCAVLTDSRWTVGTEG